jgi:hypothetical protein
VISIQDNDALAARLAYEVKAGLLILMTDVDGLYSSPPGEEGARLRHTYSPLADSGNIVFGQKSRVGLGGMDSKVNICWGIPASRTHGAQWVVTGPSGLNYGPHLGKSHGDHLGKMGPWGRWAPLHPCGLHMVFVPLTPKWHPSG